MTGDTHRERNVPRRIGAMLLAMGTAAVAALLAISFWMSRTVDRITVEHTQHLVELRLEGQVARLTAMVKDYADWQAAYDWIIAQDDEAVHDNIGTGATETDAFSHLKIYSGAGEGLYAFRSGGDGSDLSLLDDDMARRFIAPLQDGPVWPHRAVWGVEIIDGHLALVAAALVVPDETGARSASDFPVLLVMYALDGSEVQAIAQDLMLEQFSQHLHTDTSADTGPPGASDARPGDVLAPAPARLQAGLFGENTLALARIDGPIVGHFAWPAPTLGAQLLGQTSTVLVLLSLLVFLCSTLVGRLVIGQAQAYASARLQARTDPLTGLLNRMGLRNVVNLEEVRGRIAAGEAALLYVDLDSFKELNDAHGHPSGDAALIELAHRLTGAVRQGDTVARLGGDEFVILALDEAPELAATRITNRLTQEIARPFALPSGARIGLQVSIGVAHAKPGTEWQTLLNTADQAMYAHKNRRKETDRAAYFALATA